MNVTQLSVFMENKPGHLQSVLKILSDANINIVTLTIAETSDFGILRNGLEIRLTRRFNRRARDFPRESGR